MEDAKLQKLHETLSKLQGRKGLGTNTQYSWQSTAISSQERHPAAANLPKNALYSNFLPEGVYEKGAINDGDGRAIKRNFSDMESSDDSIDSKAKKKKRKKRLKEEQKAALKAEKLQAKRDAKLKEKKRLKKEAKKKLAQVVNPGKHEQSEISLVKEKRVNRKKKEITDAEKLDKKERKKKKLEAATRQTAGESSSPVVPRKESKKKKKRPKIE